MSNIRRQMSGKIKRFLRLALSAAIAILGVVAAPAPISAGSNNPNDLIIVVNKSVKENQLSIDQVRNLFLLTKLSWPGGNRAVVLNSRDAKLRETFRKKVLSMTADDEKRFWQDQMIRNGRHAPPEFGDDMLKAVFRLKGSIGYVYRKDLISSVVKVVLEIPAG